MRLCPSASFGSITDTTRFPSRSTAQQVLPRHASPSRCRTRSAPRAQRSAPPPPPPLGRRAEAQPAAGATPRAPRSSHGGCRRGAAGPRAPLAPHAARARGCCSSGRACTCRWHAPPAGHVLRAAPRRVRQAPAAERAHAPSPRQPASRRAARPLMPPARARSSPSSTQHAVRLSAPPLFGSYPSILLRFFPFCSAGARHSAGRDGGGSRPAAGELQKELPTGGAARAIWPPRAIWRPAGRPRSRVIWARCRRR